METGEDVKGNDGGEEDEGDEDDGEGGEEMGCDAFSNSRMNFGRRSKPKRQFIMPGLRQAVPENSKYVEAVTECHWKVILLEVTGGSHGELLNNTYSVQNLRWRHLRGSYKRRRHQALPNQPSGTAGEDAVRAVQGTPGACRWRVHGVPRSEVDN